MGVNKIRLKLKECSYNFLIKQYFFFLLSSSIYLLLLLFFFLPLFFFMDHLFLQCPKDAQHPTFITKDCFSFLLIMGKGEPNFGRDFILQRGDTATIPRYIIRMLLAIIHKSHQFLCLHSFGSYPWSSTTYHLWGVKVWV